jgi:hypothetical protein
MTVHLPNPNVLHLRTPGAEAAHRAATATSLPPQRLKEHADARRKIVVRKGAKLWLAGAGGCLTHRHRAASLLGAVRLCTGATMSGSDEAEIAKWLAHKGATKRPPKAARELGPRRAELACHASLATTQRYIEGSTEAKQRGRLYCDLECGTPWR